MKLKQLISIITPVALVCVLTSSPAQAVIALAEYAFNIDGTVSEPTLGDPVPAEVDLSAFDPVVGLGSIGVTITGAGAHTFDTFFDHEIDETINTFFNESGAANGAAATGQSWEIDEPGFVFGDIFDNFSFSTLDNTNAVPAGLEDDVSMALGWDFTLDIGEIATIDLLLSTSAPGGGFFLSQTDPDSQESIFFSGNLNIAPIPVPAAVWLFGSGLLGLIGAAARKKVP